MKTNKFTFIRIAVSFLLLGLLFWLMRNEFGSIWTTISGSTPKYLLIAIVLVLINTIMLGYRLKIIFKGENIDISFLRAVQLTYIGYYFNNFMPTAVGGDIVKGHYAARMNNKKLKSYASVLMDRFIGLYSFLIVAAIALFVDHGRFQIALLKPIVLCILLMGAIGFVVLTNKTVAKALGVFFGRFKFFSIGEKLNSFYEVVHDYRNRLDIVARSLFISIAAQSIYFVSVSFFIISLGKSVSIGNIFLLMPVVVFISMIPSLGGLGVREGAIVTLFTPLIGKETAFALSLLILSSLLLVSIIGGLVNLYWGFTVGAVKDDQAQP